jgi:hypothetical protein
MQEITMKLLNIDANAKTVKGQKQGYITGIMYMAPAKVSGYEVCPMATAGCKAACLNTAGRGAFSTVQKSRIAKTKYFFENRTAFMAQLVKEITALIRKAKRLDMIPTVRLNGTSDIVWEIIPVLGKRNIMEHFPEVQFYDYTKRHNRKNLPANYHLTYSLAENNDALANTALNNGMSVAAVFRNEATVLTLEETGYLLQGLRVPVVSGDESDLRFLDPKSVIVGLYAKGKAKKDTSGFVRDAN